MLVIQFPSQLQKHILHSTLWCSAKGFSVFSSFLAPPKEGSGATGAGGEVGVRWDGQRVVALLALAVRSVPPSSGLACSSRSSFSSSQLPPRISLVHHSEVCPQKFSQKCPPTPRLPHPLDGSLRCLPSDVPLRHLPSDLPPSEFLPQRSFLGGPSFRCPPSDIPPLDVLPLMSLPKSCPLRCPPLRSFLRGPLSDLFPQTACLFFPQTASLRCPLSEVL